MITIQWRPSARPEEAPGKTAEGGGGSRARSRGATRQGGKENCTHQERAACRGREDRRETRTETRQDGRQVGGGERVDRQRRHGPATGHTPHHGQAPVEPETTVNAPWRGGRSRRRVRQERSGPVAAARDTAGRMAPAHR